MWPGRGYDQFTDEQREVVIAAFPRGNDFKHWEARRNLLAEFRAAFHRGADQGKATRDTLRTCPVTPAGTHLLMNPWLTVGWES
jgi:hypothetical protein